MSREGEKEGEREETASFFFTTLERKESKESRAKTKESKGKDRERKKEGRRKGTVSVDGLVAVKPTHTTRYKCGWPPLSLRLCFSPGRVATTLVFSVWQSAGWPPSRSAATAALPPPISPLSHSVQSKT
jgi:hypothetical protein